MTNHGKTHASQGTDGLICIKDTHGPAPEPP